MKIIKAILKVKIINMKKKMIIKMIVKKIVIMKSDNEGDAIA